MRSSIALVILLLGCTPDALPEPPTAPIAAEQPAPKPVAPVVIIPQDPVAAVSVLPPKLLPRAGEKSIRDASDYVAWPRARAENVEKLTVLTSAVSRSLSAMEAHKVAGVYRAADVVSARVALRELRTFLRVKGD